MCAPHDTGTPKRTFDWSRMVRLASLCVVLLMGTACWGTPAAEPEPTATVAAVAATPTPLPSPTPTAVTASVLTRAMTTSVSLPITAELVPAAVPTNTVGVTATGQSTSNVALPLVTSAECSIEADLDLAGYEDLPQRMGCPLEPANFDPVGVNEFGPGPQFDRFMLWFGSELKIYVLLPDKRWTVYDDTWSEDQPLFTCNPLDITPASPPLPRRGFNKIWCTVDGLQEIMGTVIIEERLCQHAVVQRFEQGRLLACYEDATIRYIRLLDDGTWDTELTR